MPRYLVRCENNPVGEVEAPDERTAVDAAYKLRNWTPREAMSLLKLPESTVMHILIDTTNGRALARHESYRALACLHYIQFTNVDATILRIGATGENKVWSQFSHEQLMSILAYAGVTITAKDYTGLIKLCRETLENAPWLLLPFTLQQLEQQAFAINPGDDRPMAFDPNNTTPALTGKWTSEPQINRKRADSSFWVNFAAGEPSGQSNASALPATGTSARVRGRNSPLPSNEETMASTKAAKKAATKKVAKKTAPAKKAAAKKTAAPAKKSTTAGTQEERNGIKRPKPGGNTAQVWDACDALMAKLGKAPSFKEVDEYIEKKNDQIPTATRRSNYAVWRKFNGITGRVS